MRNRDDSPTAHEVSRERLKKDASDVLRAARERAGLSALSVAADLGYEGKSASRFYAWEDRNALSAPAPLDAIMHPALLPHAVEKLAARAGMFVYEPPDVGATCDFAMLAEVAKETSEVVAAHSAVCAQGHRTRATTAELIRETDEAIVALLRLRASLEATADEPVVGVVRELRRA